jgi:hypothetical protein
MHRRGDQRFRDRDHPVGHLVCVEHAMKDDVGIALGIMAVIVAMFIIWWVWI